MRHSSDMTIRLRSILECTKAHPVFSFYLSSENDKAGTCFNISEKYTCINTF